MSKYAWLSLSTPESEAAAVFLGPRPVGGTHTRTACESCGGSSGAPCSSPTEREVKKLLRPLTDGQRLLYRLGFYRLTTVCIKCWKANDEKSEGLV